MIKKLGTGTELMLDEDPLLLSTVSNIRGTPVTLKRLAAQVSSAIQEKLIDPNLLEVRVAQEQEGCGQSYRMFFIRKDEEYKFNRGHKYDFCLSVNTLAPRVVLFREGGTCYNRLPATKNRIVTFFFERAKNWTNVKQQEGTQTFVQMSA